MEVSLVFIIFWSMSIFWVLFDAHEIGASSDLDTGAVRLGPIGWLVLMLVIWLVALPLYIAKRNTIREAALAQPKPSKWRRSAR